MPSDSSLETILQSSDVWYFCRFVVFSAVVCNILQSDFCFLLRTAHRDSRHLSSELANVLKDMKMANKRKGRTNRILLGHQWDAVGTLFGPLGHS